MKTRRTISGYQFDDDKELIKIPIFVNFLLAILLLVGFGLDFSASERVILCLISGGVLILINKYYDWRSPKKNITLALMYFSIFIIELSQLGFPARLLPMDTKSIMSKGFMFDMMISVIPYLYIGLRLMLIYPLIKIVDSSSKLKKEQ